MPRLQGAHPIHAAEGRSWRSARPERRLSTQARALEAQTLLPPPFHCALLLWTLSRARLGCSVWLALSSVWSHPNWTDRDRGIPEASSIGSQSCCPCAGAAFTSDLRAVVRASSRRPQLLPHRSDPSRRRL